jgi:hypothetical protein
MFPNRVILYFARLLLTLYVVFALGIASAQQSPKPLTNEDVISMVKNGLPESVIVGSMQANPTNFDVTPNGLIALKKAGVGQKVMDAMLAAETNKRNSSGAVASAPAAATPSNATVSPGQPAVTAISKGGRQGLNLEKTQLAETKTKPSSMGALAGDSAVNQALREGINQAAWQTAVHSGSYGSYSAINSATSIGGGLLSHKKSNPTVTYVWALSGPNSTSSLTSNMPNFDVSFAGIPGVNASDYEPAIVRLTMTPNNWRLVGATEGKAGNQQSSAFDWPVYSSFVEERVPTTVKQIGPGHDEITPSSALAPGEYGVVLRPLSKGKQYSGSEISKSQGDGLCFNSVWSFQVK